MSLYSNFTDLANSINIALQKAGGKVHIGTTPPEDTNLLWIDPSDETIETFIDGENTEFPLEVGE